MQLKINQKFVVKSIQGNNFVIAGYASVYDIADHHNDIIVQGAFDSFESSNVKFLWQHQQTKPIGIIQTIHEDSYGLKIEAIINNKIEAGREAIELIKQGAINSLSVGFNIISSSYNDQGARVIEKAELIEISIVTFPANAHAQINYIHHDTPHLNNNENFKGVDMSDELTLKKISKLEAEICNINGFLSRPDMPTSSEMEYKGLFNNYIRKGIEADLITKSFSGGENEGGVLLVPTLYNKIISSLTSLSPMRMLASVETISTNALDVVIEDGDFISGWVGETETRGDTNTPKLIQKRIPVHELFAQPKATQKLVDDSAIQIENWLTERLKDLFLKSENEAFIKGDGDKKPTGILGADHKIKTIVAEELNPELLIDLINSLSEEYLANATFLINRTTLAEIQKLKDNNGKFIWQPSFSDSIKQTIFGIPVVCCAEMPSIADDTCPIAIGDFKAAYKIVDRSGVHIMRDPYTDKPFIKFYAVKRVGGDVVNPKAISFAKITKA